MDSNIVAFLKTRKFWTPLLSLIIVIVAAFIPDFPYSPEAVVEFLLPIILVIVGGDVIYDVAGQLRQ
jgi:hypothetical protein